jgi:hypothetical protein
MVAAADERRGQVFQWLQDSFEGVSSQLRVLSDNLSRQQQALAGMTDAQEAAERLSRLADALPERIGAAVQEALTAGRHSGKVGPYESHVIGTQREHRPVGPDPDRRSAVDDVILDLRQSAHLVHHGPVTSPLEAEQPVDETGIAEPSMAEPVASHVGGPGAQHTAASDPSLRSQLGSLASSVHTRINRSGWQEKLRSLSTR